MDNILAEAGIVTNGSAPIFEPGNHGYSKPMSNDGILLIPNIDDSKRFAWNPECIQRMQSLRPPVKRIAIDSLCPHYGNLPEYMKNFIISMLPGRPCNMGIQPTLKANGTQTYELFILAGDCGFEALSGSLEETIKQWIPKGTSQTEVNKIFTALQNLKKDDGRLGIATEEVVDDVVVMGNILLLASISLAILQKMHHADTTHMSRRRFLIRSAQVATGIAAVLSGFTKLYSDIEVSSQKDEIMKNLLMKLDSVDLHLSSDDATTFLKGRTALLTQKLVDGFTYFPQDGSQVVLMGDAHVVDADLLMTNEEERLQAITALGKMYKRYFTQTIFRGVQIPQATYNKFLENIVTYLASYSIIKAEDNGLPYEQGGNISVDSLGENINIKIYATLCQAFNIPNSLA